MRRSLLWDSTVRNMHYALRLLLRMPGSTGAILVLLALGIGANAGVFSLANAALLNALPVRDPQTLYFVEAVGLQAQRGGVSYPLFQSLRNETSALSHLAAFQTAELAVTIDGEFESVSAQYVSDNFFDLLGVRAVLGRVLLSENEQTMGRVDASGSVAVISHHFWEQRFGRRPDVLGKPIRVGERMATIVGVTGPEFFGLQPGQRVDVTFPLTLVNSRVLENNTASFLTAVGRLPVADSIDTAHTELQALLTRWVEGEGISDNIRGGYFSRVRLSTANKGLDALRLQFSGPLLVLMAIVGLVLFLACTNVASLLLMRMARRQQELSTRVALGANRSELVRQAAAETFLLVAGGTLLGLLVGWGTVNVLASLLLDPSDGFHLDVPLDARVVAFTATVALVAGLICGVAPVLWISRISPAQVIQQQSRAVIGGRGMLARGLLLCQVALAIMLLTATGLLARTLQALHSVDKGFQPEGVLAMRVEANNHAFSEAEIGGLWSTLLDDVRTIPGVSQVSFSSLTPLTTGGAGAIIGIPGFVAGSDADLQVTRNEVSPGYFSVMKIPVLAGRTFTTSDTADGQRVAMMSETAARFYFGGIHHALGKSFTLGQEFVQIVGVVQDTAYRSLREQPPRLLYLPLSQGLEQHFALTLAVGTSVDPLSLHNVIQDRINNRSGQILLRDAKTMDAQVEDSLRQERTLATLSTAFGSLALLLSAVGLYGMLLQSVIGRTREIGLRIAMGATPMAISRLLLKNVVLMMTIGVGLGLGGSLAVGRLLESQLFGVRPVDPVTLTATLLIFGITAAAACAIPLRYAVRIDPLVAIRDE
ncbi:MAG: FtsX-like permease family protein [Luteitalea sp.]|nr:FtsX-like permease family protein [Luteitalea sp.]